MFVQDSEITGGYVRMGIYIKSRITNPKRMTAKGYGETQLVNNCECEDDIISNCTEAEHQANRRIEFRIIKH